MEKNVTKKRKRNYFPLAKNKPAKNNRVRYLLKVEMGSGAGSATLQTVL